MGQVTVRPDGLITSAQAAELCGVSVKTIYAWAHSGLLPVKRSSQRRILLNLLDVLRADNATRKAARRTAVTYPAWEIDGEPDTDYAAILRACRDGAASTPVLRQSVVYYLRFADRIKIGTSTRYLARMRELPKDELLVTEPGGDDLERARHRQFAALRIRGEWFRAEAPLLAHIVRLRADLAPAIPDM